MSAVTPVPSSDETVPVATTATGQGGTTTPVSASSINLSSMASLQKDAPQVFNAMMLGMGMQGIQKMQDSEARRKQIAREGEQ